MLSYLTLTVPRLVPGIQASVMALNAGQGAFDHVSDCADLCAARYDKPVECSACIAWPFQSRQRGLETKRGWPGLFAEAVELDAKKRGGLALQRTPYLHMLRMPLAQAVALPVATWEPQDRRTGSGTSVWDSVWGVTRINLSGFGTMAQERLVLPFSCPCRRECLRPLRTGSPYL